jgi:hypothetical protein
MTHRSATLRSSTRVDANRLESFDQIAWMDGTRAFLSAA